MTDIPPEEAEQWRKLVVKWGSTVSTAINLLRFCEKAILASPNPDANLLERIQVFLDDPGDERTWGFCYRDIPEGDIPDHKR